MASGREFKALDGMRGVAALAVVLLHSYALIGLVAPGGYLAVDLFFVLSGFVIAFAYERKLLKTLSAWDFFRMRLVRFYPLYAAGLLLGIAAAVAAAALKPAASLPAQGIGLAALLNAAFIPAPFDRDQNLFALNVPAWSLFFELLVNLAYALAVRRLSNRVLVALASVSGAGLAAMILVHGSADLGARMPSLAGGALRTIFSFTVGVLLYRWRPLVGRPPAILLLVAVGALLLAPVPPGLPRALFDLGFVVVLSPLLVALGAAAPSSEALAPVFDYLGEISFAIYALHYPLLWAARGLTNTILPHASLALFAAVLTVLLIGCPLVVRLYDEPVRRLFRVRTLSVRPAL